MYNITIGRLADDPEAQGVIRPADDSWQLVIDKEGIPHLWVRTKSAEGDGMIAVDLFLVEDVTVKALMLSEFGGELTDPAEIAEAEQTWAAEKDRHGLPEPKV
jgi:hypothetical protein